VQHPFRIGVCLFLAGQRPFQNFRVDNMTIQLRNPLLKVCHEPRKSNRATCSVEQRIHDSPHLSTRQYARIVEHWVTSIGLDPAVYGTHSMRRTKATLVYRRTKNLRTVQLLLGHTKLESTVRYLGIEVDDALEISEQTEI
jgi:integrase